MKPRDTWSVSVEESEDPFRVEEGQRLYSVRVEEQ